MSSVNPFPNITEKSYRVNKKCFIVVLCVAKSALAIRSPAKRVKIGSDRVKLYAK